MSARILLDVDGPLTRGFADAFCEELRRAGAPAWVHELEDWDIAAHYKLKGSAAEKAAYAALSVPGRCLAFDTNPGALEFVEWCRARAEVLAVTAPLDGSATWCRDRELWLRDRLAIDEQHVIHARNKVPVGGTVFVDDRAKNVRDWQAEHPDGRAILWRESWNRHDAWVYSARGYDQLRALIAGALGENA